MLLKITNKKYFVNTKKQFNQKLNLHLNSKYKKRNLSDADKKTLIYYLGFIDGKSGKKVQNFLNTTFNK